MTLYHEPEDSDELQMQQQEHAQARQIVITTLDGIWELAHTESQSGSRVWRKALPLIEDAQRAARIL